MGSVDKDCTIGSFSAVLCKYSTIASSSFVPATGPGGGASKNRRYEPVVAPIARKSTAYIIGLRERFGEGCISIVEENWERRSLGLGASEERGAVE